LKRKRREFDTKKKQAHRRQQLIQRYKPQRLSLLSTIRRSLKQTNRVRQVHPVHPSVPKARAEIRRELSKLQFQSSLVQQEQSQSSPSSCVEQQLTLYSDGNSNNNIDNASGEESYNEILSVDDINLQDHIKVETTRNGSPSLHVATDILSKDKKPYKRFPWAPVESAKKRTYSLSIYSEELWRTGIVKHLKKEHLSTPYAHWSKFPKGSREKNDALRPILEDLRSQMINHPIISKNIKAVIMQSQSTVKVDDRCPVDSSLAEHVVVVQSQMDKVSLHIATDVGEFNSQPGQLSLQKVNGWRVKFNFPSNASDMWKVLQPLIGALKSELLKGIDLNRGYGLTIAEKTEILQGIQHYILTSKKMSRAVKDFVDNTEGQATPTSNDIFLRNQYRLEGEDLARTKNAATTSFYETCYSQVAEIELQFINFDDSIVGKELKDVVRDAATAIVSSYTCNFFGLNKSRSWRQFSSEYAIDKTYYIMMQPERSRQYHARMKDELRRRAAMSAMYRGCNDIHGLRLLDMTDPDHLDELKDIILEAIRRHPWIRYWYTGDSLMTSDGQIAKREAIGFILRNLICKPTGRGLRTTDVGPTSNQLCQVVEIPLCATVGGAAARLGEISNIETFIDLEAEDGSDITCLNQGFNGCDTDKRDGVSDRIHILYATGLVNFGDRLRSNELNLCLHGCNTSVVARWDKSIPPAEQNYIEWDPRVRHERESTKEAGKIRVTYKLVS